MKKLVVGIVFWLLALVPIFTASAKGVTVDISPFTHNIVFTDFYNYAVEYPVLLYGNVSYIPLTSSMCSELYLSVAFSSEEGFYVARGGGRGNIGTERTNVLGSINYKNPENGKVEAVIPEYPIYLNGRLFDNKNTRYPFLNFRGITYLPLTYDIITKEFDFEFAFDNEKKHLTLHGNSWYSSPSFVASNEEYIEIQDYRSVYSESVDENGFTVYHHEYDYSDYYRISLADDAITKMPSDYKPSKSESAGEEKTPDPRFRIEEERVYFENEQIMTLFSYGYDYGLNTASAQIYDYDDITFIIVTTWNPRLALPRGTTRRYHIFVKTDGKTTELDFADAFSHFFYDGKEAWYIVSSSGNQERGNSFSEIYRYTKKYGFERLSDRYENCNSLEYIGTHNGKMYVFAALREGNRDIAYSGESLDPMHSGYYVINEDLTITKISPYMGARTEVILAANGNLYAITNYSTFNRIINLGTGEIIAEL